VWHRIAGVKLHHSLKHALCHPEFLPPPPPIQIWPHHWPPQTAAARNVPTFNRFWLIHLCDRRTDGWVIAYSALSIYAVVRQKLKKVLAMHLTT